MARATDRPEQEKGKSDCPCILTNFYPLQRTTAHIRRYLGLDERSVQAGVDSGLKLDRIIRVNEIIYPRSPRETMEGWVHLPRFIDKIRLHLAGKLHPDYQPNFTKGFDAKWLEAAGVAADQVIDVVRRSITDGEVADWVRKNVRKTEAEKAAFANYLLNRGRNDDASARLEQRKQECGLAHRKDIQTFVDFIDADEKRI